MTDQEVQKLMDEEAMLARRQADVKQRLLALNAGKVPPSSAEPRKAPPSVVPSETCTGSESEDDLEEGDLGLGFGTVNCPKTGKAA